MKIAFIVDQFPTISETFVINQMTGLIDLGHEVTIFAGSTVKEENQHPEVLQYDLLEKTFNFNYEPGAKFTRFLKAVYLLIMNFTKNPSAITRSLNFFKYGREALALTLFYKTILLINAGEFDVYHCHFGWNGNLAYSLRDIGALRGKIVTTFHGADMSSYLKSQGEDVYKELFQKGDLFLPISEYWKKKLIHLGCPEEKIIVHHMGIDVEKFEYKERKLSDEHAVELLSIARLVQKKGLQYSIGAVIHALSRYPNIKYSVIGSGPLQEELEGLVREKAAEDKISFLGGKPQNVVIDYMSKADIFVVPSVSSERGDQEGIPVVLMEAMARGLPVLSTRHSGIPELVEDGRSGFLVEEKNEQALAEKLLELIEHPSLRSQMGLAGRQCVQEHFNIKKLNHRLVGIFEELMTKT